MKGKFYPEIFKSLASDYLVTVTNSEIKQSYNSCHEISDFGQYEFQDDLKFISRNDDAIIQITYTNNEDIDISFNTIIIFNKTNLKLIFYLKQDCLFLLKPGDTLSTT